MVKKTEDLTPGASYTFEVISVKKISEEFSNENEKFVNSYEMGKYVTLGKRHILIVTAVHKPF